MHRIFQTFIDGLAESSDEQALRRAMEVTARQLDLSSFAYLVLPGRTKGQARLISNYPTDWTTHYLQNHYERFDPVIQSALANPEPFEWGLWSSSVSLSRPQIALMEEAAFFGIRYGFTIPVHDRQGPIAAMTYAAHEMGSVFRRCIERHCRVLQLMALYFHARACGTFARDRVVSGVWLSPRELECLEWAAQGKTAWEIGVILGIARRTVSFHLDNAKAKLGVRTIPQAVVQLTISRSKRRQL